MTGAFLEAASWVVAQLAAVDVAASLDPADLNPPAVWVTPASLTLPTLDDALTEVALDLYLVVGSLPAAQALDALDALAAQVRQAVTFHQLAAVQVALPNHNPAGLPAYRASIALHVKE